MSHYALGGSSDTENQAASHDGRKPEEASVAGAERSSTTSPSDPSSRWASLRRVFWRSRRSRGEEEEEPDSEKSNLYEELLRIVRERIQPDAVVRIGESQHPVHLIVLQCFSRTICDLGQKAVVELPEEQVTPRAFSLIYDWMIEDRPLLPRLGILEVLQAARYLQVPQLIAQCDYCLSAGIAEDSAMMLYLEARILKVEQEYRHLLSRVSKFFLPLVATREFLRLPLAPLLVLLTSNHVGVNSELEIFMAAARWLDYKWPQRKEHLAAVVSGVRFGLVPPWLLARLQKPDLSAEEVRRIVEEPPVREAIHDGIAYTTTRLYYGAEREAFAEHLARTKSTAPVQRTWIYDRRCRHHHRLHCKVTQELTFEAFVDYLEFLQSQPRDYWHSFEPVEASHVCFGCSNKEKEKEEGKKEEEAAKQPTERP
ncbi:kelch-like protein diablo [Drosophila ficusphila]|uniref:kelch-like protein diablo n=1 Tax=Drosophila ficusphila TaxID=30025 RepID=UPI001C8B0166|nr:kelch-like protein diablo [Drosophila ficusphila]